MAGKKKKRAAAPAERGAQGPAPRERQRAPGGVPPAEAFDHLKRRPPPNLPGREGPPAHSAAGATQGRGGGQAGGRGGAAGSQGGTPAAGRGPAADGRNGGPSPAGRGQSGAGNGRTSVAGRGKGGNAGNPASATQEERPRPPANPARRRRNRRIAAAVTIALLIALGCFFTVTTLFKIEHFELEGECAYSLEEVTAAFGHAVGDNLYGFSAGSAEGRIQSALPYIETVAVRRRLPSTVVFKVEPAVETYSVPLPEGGYAVLSATRKVLRQADETPGGLLELRGLSGVVLEPGLPLALVEDSVPAVDSVQSAVGKSDSAADAASTPPADPEAETAEAARAAADRYAVLDLLLAAIEKAGLGEVDWVDVADPLVLKIGWQGRITVLLGPRSGLDEKLATAAVLLTDSEKNLVDGASRGTLDMTYYTSTGRSYFRPE